MKFAISLLPPTEAPHDRPTHSNAAVSLGLRPTFSKNQRETARFAHFLAVPRSATRLGGRLAHCFAVPGLARPLALGSTARTQPGTPLASHAGALRHLHRLRAHASQRRPALDRRPASLPPCASRS